MSDPDVVLMRQYAPFPETLARLVDVTTYRPGWKVRLLDIERDPPDTHGASAGGLTLRITTLGYNSYHTDEGVSYRVHHYIPVPAATYNEASWLRWLFECFLLVERHETMEFFSVDGRRPFAPTHGPGDDPYIIHEAATEQQVATSFRGVINE